MSDAHARVRAYTRGGERLTLEVSAPSAMGLGIELGLLNLGNKHFLPLSHLAGPLVRNFKKKKDVCILGL